MIPVATRLNVRWSQQGNFSKLITQNPSNCSTRTLLSLKSLSSGNPSRRPLSTTTASKAEPIQFASLHPNVRTILPNSVSPPPPPLPWPPQPISTQSKSLNSALQRRAYSPQHFYQNRILDQYVSQPANKITLRQLIVFGRNLSEERIIRSGNYVRTELPIRLAHRIRDFQNLPFIVGTNPHIAQVYDLYWTAFEIFTKFPPIKSMEENDEFCNVLRTLLKKHLVVIPQLAMGIIECGEHLTKEQVDRFMNTMLRSRISRRVLAEQQIALTENWHDPGYGFGLDKNGGYIGVVSTHCDAKEIIERYAEEAGNLFKKVYNNIEPPTVIINGDTDTIFSYIPDHIEYIIYELLKNSMRGVIENSSKDPGTQLPPILVTICSGQTDIYIRISDQGGGISDEVYPHIWSFSHTSNDKKFSHKFTNFSKVPRMAATVHEYEQWPPNLHLGIGLPMSKVYAEYFGGELTIFTMDGYGTDAYVKITRLGNKEENLV